MSRPLIFITNDDSLLAKGIASLVEAARPFGDIVVIAPDKPQSGMGHAITIHDPLRLHPEHLFEGIEAYSCTGTPVDCVKLGVYEILHRKPDLLLSGINHGCNASTNILYSGTMSAAVEGAMEHIPSIGFSLDNFDHDADFSTAKAVAAKVIEKVLANGLPDGVCLNVNIPNVAPADLKGIQVCKQAYAYWEDRFDKRQDPFGKTYYWLTGTFNVQEESTGTDLYYLAKGFATVVPTQFDLTAHSAINSLNEQFS
ncbi:MAG TPA: 5'/3'-nucleotidase SurE [Fluviicola sp.]|nr:5'/3'-nucleotidase SurE [Fluviicola sp.]